MEKINPVNLVSKTALNVVIRQLKDAYNVTHLRYIEMRRPNSVPIAMFLAKLV